MLYGFIPAIVGFLVRSRIAAFLVCAAGVVLTSLGLIHCVLALRSYPAEPMAVPSTEAASAHGWIRIRDARLDCERGVAGANGESSFPLRDTGASDVVVVIKGPCGAAAHDLNGVVDPMPSRRARFFESNGMIFRPGAERYELCVMCGPENDRLGVIVCSILFLVCAGLYPLLAYSRRRKYPHLAGR